MTEALGTVRGPSYETADRGFIRRITSVNQPIAETIKVDLPSATPEWAWHMARLRGAVAESNAPPEKTLEIVDLFAGAGGFALGVGEAVIASGFRPRVSLAVDLDSEALDIHGYNLNTRQPVAESVRALLRIESLLNSAKPKALARSSLVMPGWPPGIRSTDILIGGPPCQGHSNLNNRTRRRDSRNELYLWMAAAAQVTKPQLILVENVSSVHTDAGDALLRTMELLQSLGYVLVFNGVLSADRFGVAQSRKRHFLIAVQADSAIDNAAELVTEWLTRHESPLITSKDAIEDLTDVEGTTEFDTASSLSSANEARVQWLHAHDAFDLPNHLRPKSHRDGHTYPSVYGRMYPDRPAQTLSTGFLSPGRGRFTHPTQSRSLTLHEGARLQGIPDNFKFVSKSGNLPNRTKVATMIGDAVPPPLAFHVALAGLQAIKFQP